MRIVTKLLLLVLVLAVRPTAAGQTADGATFFSSTSDTSVRDAPLGGLGRPFRLDVGHQGLFFDRFDYVPGTPPLEAGDEIDGVYYNRNRHYSPELGRFLQADVNATGMPLLAAMAFHGQTLDALLDEFDGLMQYVDGMNLYLYVSANPITGFDPSGLASLGQLLGGAAGSAALFAGQALSSSAAKGAIAGLFAAIMYNEAMRFIEMGEEEYLGQLARDAQIASTLPGGANMAQLMILRIYRIARGATGRIAVRTVDDVFRNPKILQSIRNPAEATDLIEAARRSGWLTDNLRHGAHRGQGFAIREMKDGNLTGRVIFWHPGGGHHGPRPYWKVSSGEGVVRIFVDQ